MARSALVRGRVALGGSLRDLDLRGAHELAAEPVAARPLVQHGAGRDVGALSLAHRLVPRRVEGAPLRLDALDAEGLELLEEDDLGQRDALAERARALLLAHRPDDGVEVVEDLDHLARETGRDLLAHDLPLAGEA